MAKQKALALLCCRDEPGGEVDGELDGRQLDDIVEAREALRMLERLAREPQVGWRLDRSRRRPSRRNGRRHGLGPYVGEGQGGAATSGATLAPTLQPTRWARPADHSPPSPLGWTGDEFPATPES